MTTIAARFAECPCCAAHDWRLAWNNPDVQPLSGWKDFMYGGRRFIGAILECAGCGFRFVQSPTPGDAYYAGADHSTYSALSPARQRYFAELKASLQRRGLSLREGASMIDLGAGEGDWLAAWPEVRSRYATERQPTLIRRMNDRGIATVESLDQVGGRRFDLVSAFDFLEHVEDPDALLRGISAHMAEGATLVIGVPDMGKWAARLFGTRYYLVCPMHYSYFTRKSLRALLRKHFTQVDVFASPPMRTTLAGVAKWVAPRLRHAALDRLWLPVGYRASLVATARKSP